MFVYIIFTFHSLFTIDLYSYLLDIDECSHAHGGCHGNADCQNTVGSFICSCKAGYNGDGFNCVGRLLLLKKKKNYFVGNLREEISCSNSKDSSLLCKIFWSELTAAGAPYTYFCCHYCCWCWAGEQVIVSIVVVVVFVATLLEVFAFDIDDFAVICSNASSFFISVMLLIA